MPMIVVKVAFDAEAAVWFVEASDLPGLNLEAETVELLLGKIPAAVEDLLEESGHAPGEIDVSIEVIAHASARARPRAHA